MLKKVIASFVLLIIACTLTQAIIGDHCASGADCAADECCVTNNRPIGKRQFFGSTCHQMGVVGSGCFVSSTSGKPDHVVFGCPCSAGLVCHGTGMFDVPLGEVGKCGV